MRNNEIDVREGSKIVKRNNWDTRKLAKKRSREGKGKVVSKGWIHWLGKISMCHGERTDNGCRGLQIRTKRYPESCWRSM